MTTIYLAAVTHDLRTHNLEATWLEDTGTELRRVKCHTYAPSQRDMFLADTGDAGTPYVVSAGWTDEFVAAWIAEEERLAAEAQARADEEAAQKKAAEKAAFDAEVARQAEILKAAQAIVEASS